MPRLVDFCLKLNERESEDNKDSLKEEILNTVISVFINLTETDSSFNGEFKRSDLSTSILSSEYVYFFV